MKQIRAGILGSGFMAAVHARNLEKIEDIKIAAICSANIENARALSASLSSGDIKAYDDFYCMLDETEIDVLYVCIPPFAHNGQVEAAAKKGIHLFIEKPIAMDTNRGLSMVTAIKEAGVLSQVGYHTRFGSAVRELKKMIEDGRAGVPTLFDGRYDCNSLHSSWWRDRTKSGGQVFEQAIHTYDMAIHLMGEPDTVTGLLGNMCHQGISEYTVEDTSVSAIRFKSGALANICASNCAVPMEWNNTFTVICGKLTAYFANPNKAEFVFTSGNEVHRINVEEECDMYFEETKAFIAAVRGNAPNICTIEEGLKSLKLVESVVKSSEKGGQLEEFI